MNLAEQSILKIITEANRVVGGSVSAISRDVLNSSFPRDFELYLCALELVDSNGDLIDFFSFPIMPNNISKQEAEATTVQTSLGGITILNRDSFVPKNLSLSGDFGRAFKFTEFGNGFYDTYYKAAAIKNQSIANGYYSAKDVNSNKSSLVNTLPMGIKTGFGCIKVLQSIIDKAKAHDNFGRTFRLFFHNPSLGEAYLVIPNKQPLSFTQNVQSSNMVWQYSLNLTIVADLANLNGNRVASEKDVNNRMTRDKIVNLIGKNIF